MECSCGGVLLKGKSCYRTGNDDYCLIIENIPAYQCTRCDKILFEDEVVEKIQKLKNRIERDINEIITGKPSIHTYDY